MNYNFRKATSEKGHAKDELLSALQKYLRRGEVDKARYVGIELELFSELPEAVRAAAEKYFGTTVGLKAMKGVEYGETSYEIEGKKNGKIVEVTFDPTGKKGK